MRYQSSGVFPAAATNLVPGIKNPVCAQVQCI